MVTFFDSAFYPKCCVFRLNALLVSLSGSNKSINLVVAILAHVLAKLLLFKPGGGILISHDLAANTSPGFDLNTKEKGIMKTP